MSAVAEPFQVEGGGDQDQLDDGEEGEEGGTLPDILVFEEEITSGGKGGDEACYGMKGCGTLLAEAEFGGLVIGVILQAFDECSKGVLCSGEVAGEVMVDFSHEHARRCFRIGEPLKVVVGGDIVEGIDADVGKMDGIGLLFEAGGAGGCVVAACHIDEEQSVCNFEHFCVGEGVTFGSRASGIKDAYGMAVAGSEIKRGAIGMGEREDSRRRR